VVGSWTSAPCQSRLNGGGDEESVGCFPRLLFMYEKACWFLTFIPVLDVIQGLMFKELIHLIVRNNIYGVW